MKYASIVVTAALACAAGWTTRSVFSGDAPPAMPSADEWGKLAQPGEEHARLKPLAGTWKVHGKFVDPASQQAMESDSTGVFTMILGDRFLRQEITGTAMGQPFEGRGIIGFDNATKKWVVAWVDNMGTGIMVGEGSETEKGKVWTFQDKMNGPTGPITMRDVLTVKSDKEMKYESFLPGMDKPMMTLDYVRGQAK